MKTYKMNMPEITLKLKKSDVIKAKIGSSADCNTLFREVFDDSIGLYESMFCIYLNRANNTIGWMKISQGGISGTVIDIRLILNAAITSLCSSIIICHNHPSGNTQPSPVDLDITKKLKTACSTFDVHLLDHIILTEDNYFSFADEGYM